MQLLPSWFSRAVSVYITNVTCIIQINRNLKYFSILVRRHGDCDIVSLNLYISICPCISSHTFIKMSITMAVRDCSPNTCSNWLQTAVMNNILCSGIFLQLYLHLSKEHFLVLVMLNFLINKAANYKSHFNSKISLQATWSNCLAITVSKFNNFHTNTFTYLYQQNRFLFKEIFKVNKYNFFKGTQKIQKQMHHGNV